MNGKAKTQEKCEMSWTKTLLWHGYKRNSTKWKLNWSFKRKLHKIFNYFFQNAFSTIKLSVFSFKLNVSKAHGNIKRFIFWMNSQIIFYRRTQFPKFYKYYKNKIEMCHVSPKILVWFLHLIVFCSFLVKFHTIFVPRWKKIFKIKCMSTLFNRIINVRQLYAITKSNMKWNLFSLSTFHVNQFVRKT